MDVIEAIKDERLFRKYLQDANGSIKSWAHWMVALRALYGLPIRKQKTLDLVKKCTGRTKLPAKGFKSALFLTGRRSGKSRIASVVGAYEAVLSGREKKLHPGEIGMIAILSPTVKQSRVVKNYLRAIFQSSKILSELVTHETKESIRLANNIEIHIMVGDYRSIRGFSLLCAIIDEVAFFGQDESNAAKSDLELIRAISPSLAQSGGRLICISSPYSRRGWTYQMYDKHFGKDTSDFIVWNSPSRTMNPTLPQSVVDKALKTDRVSALAEFQGQFRDDVTLLLPLETIESCIIKNRYELIHDPHITYHAFADLSGGRGDDATLALAFKNKDGKIILAKLARYSPPFNPHDVCRKMASVLTRYNVKTVVGDRYAGSFVSEAFAKFGISYRPAEKSKSEYYIDLVGRLCSGQVELLDDIVLIKQLSQLERRTRSGGMDVVDHPRGQHDDSANAVAGVLDIVSQRRKKAGSWRTRTTDTENPRRTLTRFMRQHKAHIV